MFLLGLCCLSVAWGLREALRGSCKAAALRVPTKGRLCLTLSSLLWSLRGAASGFCYQKVTERTTGGLREKRDSVSFVSTLSNLNI